MKLLLIILTILTGHVTDPSGVPISYATVYPEKQPEIGTATGTDGQFRFEGDIQANDSIIISFIGYKKRVLSALVLSDMAEVQLPVILEEQPIQVEELVVETKRSKKKNKKKEMAYLLHQVMLQLEADWPKDHTEYKIVSDVRMECEDQPWGMEQMAARIIDYDQFQGLWCKRYFRPEMRQRADSLYQTNTLEKNDKNLSKRARKQGQSMRKWAVAVDSGVVVHKYLWDEGNAYEDFHQFMNDIKHWTVTRENDGHTVLTHVDKYNWLGIFKRENHRNFILDSENLSIVGFSQQLDLWLDIPFGGYKMNKDQLKLLNMLNMGETEIDKFRLRKGHAVLKLNTIYQWRDGKIYIKEKNLVVDALLQGSKKTARDIPMEIWATQRVTDLKTKDVKRMTEREMTKRLKREVVEIY